MGGGGGQAERNIGGGVVLRNCWVIFDMKLRTTLDLQGEIGQYFTKGNKDPSCLPGKWNNEGSCPVVS